MPAVANMKVFGFSTKYNNMKIFITFLFILASLFGNAQNKFSFLYSSKDSTYGYTAFNPLKMKKGNSKKSVEYSVQFLKGLRTDDNQDLIYLNRYSEMIRIISHLPFLQIDIPGCQ